MYRANYKLLRCAGTPVACLVSDVKKPPVLVFLHGAGSSGMVWREQWSYFKDSSAVVVVDLPGHGDSAGKGKDSIDAYAGIVAELIEGLASGGCVLIGHSMGGAIAQKVATARPGLLAGLVLVSTGARLRVAPQIFTAIEAGYKDYVDLSVSFSMYGPPDERTQQAFKDILAAASPEVAYDDFKACNAFDALDEVAGITTETLVVAGDRDMLTPLKYARFLHEKIAGSRLEVVPDAGHMVMMERPGAVNGAIDAFVRSLKH